MYHRQIFWFVQLKCRAVVKGGEGFPLGYCDPCLLSLKIDEKWNQMATWLEIHHFWKDIILAATTWRKA